MAWLSHAVARRKCAVACIKYKNVFIISSKSINPGQKTKQKTLSQFPTVYDLVLLLVVAAGLLEDPPQPVQLPLLLTAPPPLHLCFSLQPEHRDSTHH